MNEVVAGGSASLVTGGTINVEAFRWGGGKALPSAKKQQRNGNFFFSI